MADIDDASVHSSMTDEAAGGSATHAATAAGGSDPPPHEAPLGRPCHGGHDPTTHPRRLLMDTDDEEADITTAPIRPWFEDDPAPPLTDSLLGTHRLRAFVSALQRFDDPDVERAYLDFSQMPNLSLCSAFSFVLGFIDVVFFTFVLPHWEKRRWVIVIPNVITGGMLFLASGFFFVCWRKTWFTRGYHTERAIVAIYLLWCTATSLQTTNYARYYPEDAGATIRTYSSTREALTYATDMQAFASFTAVCVHRPRFLPYVAALMLYPFLLMPIVRWGFMPDAPFPEWLPMFVCFALGLALLFAADEVATRQRFKDNAKLKDAVHRVEVAKHDVNNLMLAMISETVLRRLVAGESVMDAVEASVVFSDVVRFTAWSSHTSPMRVIKMLCEMYRHFDSHLEAHNMEKVTTIGDAYWAACGIPTPQSDHALFATLFAVEMARGAQRLRKRFGITGIRVGVATGVVLGGVIGREEVSYQLFGEVNEHAERMEQLAPLNGVLVSRATAELLGSHDPRITLAPSTRVPDAFEVVSNDARESSSDTTSTGSSTRRHVPRSPTLASRRRLLKAPEPVLLDFEQLRQRFGVMRFSGAFADRDVERTFSAGRKAEYVVKASRCALCWVMWNVMAFGYAASRLRYSSEATWATAYTVMTALCAILAVAVYAASSHVHWIVHAVHHVAQANVHNWFIVFGPDLFAYTGDVRFSCGFTVMFLCATGFPHGPPRLAPWVFGWVTLVVPAMVAYVVRYGPSGVDIPLIGVFFVITAMLLLLSTFSSVRLQRGQCLDGCVTAVARDVVDEEHKVLTALLSRAMPPFVVAELSTWLANGRRGFISHQFKNVAVVFLKIGAKYSVVHDGAEPGGHGNTLADPANLSDDILEVQRRLTHMADTVRSQVAAVSGVMSPTTTGVVQLKVLGDVHLLAAGLGAVSTHVATAEHVTELVAVAWFTALAAAQSGEVPSVTAGIHCGPVAGGVIGDERLIYDIFGDTVNTASRVMTTSSAPGIYLSGAAFRSLYP